MVRGLAGLVRRLRGRQTPPGLAAPVETVRALVRFEGDAALVSVGSRGFFLRTGQAGFVPPPLNDFAIYALCAVSMAHGIEIRLASPVSESGAAMLRRLDYTFGLWTMQRLGPLRVVLEDVRPDAASAGRRGRVLAMSGGIDATAAALEARERTDWRHAMCIAGFDYPTADHPGFVRMLPRVRRIAERAGLELLVGATDLRQQVHSWELTYMMAIASCLTLAGGTLAGGGYGADFLPAEDHVVHPWGGSHALATVLSLPDFPIEAFNRTLGRTQKVARIARETPELVNELSVCWEGALTGGNCGRCSKCMRTKLNFIAAGLEVPPIFTDPSPPGRWLARAKVPGRRPAVLNDYVQMSDILFHMPVDAPERPAVADYRDRLRAARGLKR